MAGVGAGVVHSEKEEKTRDDSMSEKDGVRELEAKWSGFREYEVDISDGGKASLYVFDSNDDTKTYVVIELQKCPKGPPLLPIKDAEGEIRWERSREPYLHLATYLAIAMKRLTGEDWSMRIQPHLRGNYLVRYQAVVPEDHWRDVWDALMKPFAAQRTEYRKQNGGNKAPELFFGVKARAIEDDPFEEMDMNDDDSTVATDESGTKRAVTKGDGAITGSDGVPLPSAADWLEHWRHSEIPHQRTFVDFAMHLNQTELLQRSSSSPDLSLPRGDTDAVI